MFQIIIFFSLFKALLQPYTLQEICRFRIRQSIRTSIESQHADYSKINRFMSTYNKDRRFKQCQINSSSSSDGNNSDEMDEDEEDEEASYATLRRLEELLRPGVIYSAQTIDHVHSRRTTPATTSHTADRTDTDESMSNDEQLIQAQEDKQVVLSKAVDIPKAETPGSSLTIVATNNSSLGESGFGDEELLRSMPSSVESASRSMTVANSSIPGEGSSETKGQLDSKRLKKSSPPVLQLPQNLLRERIMSLQLPHNVKEFLLYNRTI
jgi:hypothetical protein